jgi:hypothetical protein
MSRAGTVNMFVVPVRQAGNRFLGSRLQIRPLLAEEEGKSEAQPGSSF